MILSRLSSASALKIATSPGSVCSMAIYLVSYRGVLLAIDAGNTNVVLGLYEGSDLVADWRIHTPATWTGDEVAILLTQLFELRGAWR